MHTYSIVLARSSYKSAPSDCPNTARLPISGSHLPLVALFSLSLLPGLSSPPLPYRPLYSLSPQPAALLMPYSNPGSTASCQRLKPPPPPRCYLPRHRRLSCSRSRPLHQQYHPQWRKPCPSRRSRSWELHHRHCLHVLARQCEAPGRTTQRPAPALPRSIPPTPDSSFRVRPPLMALPRDSTSTPRSPGRY